MGTGVLTREEWKLKEKNFIRITVYNLIYYKGSKNQKKAWSVPVADLFFHPRRVPVAALFFHLRCEGVWVAANYILANIHLRICFLLSLYKPFHDDVWSTPNAIDAVDSRQSPQGSHQSG